MLQIDTSPSSQEYFTPNSSLRQLPPPINTFVKRNKVICELVEKVVLRSKSQKSFQLRKLNKVLSYNELDRANSLETIQSADKIKRARLDWLEPFSANSKPKAYLPTFCGKGSLSPIEIFSRERDGAFGMQRTTTLPIVPQDKVKVLEKRLNNAMVFVVDDDFFVRNVIAEKFFAINSKVKINESETGDIFLEKFKIFLKDLALSNFALIIMDYSMPGISGLEAIERIRGDEDCQRLFHKIIIIAHTAEQGAVPNLKIGRAHV